MLTADSGISSIHSRIMRIESKIFYQKKEKAPQRALDQAISVISEYR